MSFWEKSFLGLFILFDALEKKTFAILFNNNKNMKDLAWNRSNFLT